MAVLVFISEIVLAVILTLLGFAILAILLTRWTRRKQNEVGISRYSSEQSAGLLDYEDDRDFSSPRSKRGRGFRNLYSTESDISYDDREGYNRNYMPSTSSLVLPQESVSDTNDLKATPEPLSGTVGPITGTIGPIMQFTAPIPGGTGPIKLSQKTIVQTPGPIVQYTGPSAETSEMTSGSTPHAVNGPAPQALTCPPSMLRGLPLAPIMISQRTSTRPEKSKVRQEPPTHVAVPIITPVPIVIGPVAAVDSSGKVTLSPMVIFPGYMDGELIKKSDSKAQILKSGSTTKFQSSQEKNKEELQKKISFTDSDEVVIAEHKNESSSFQDVELQKSKIEMGVKVKDSNAEIRKRQESQEKVRDMKMPREAAAQVEKSEVEIPQGQEAKAEKNEAETTQGQDAQAEKSEVKIPKGQEAQKEESEAKVPQGQEAQVEEHKVEIPQGQDAQAEKSEAKIPKGQDAQVEKSEAKVQGQEAQVEESKAEISQGKDTHIEKSEAKIPKGQDVQVEKTEANVLQGQEAQAEKSEAKIPKGQEVQVEKSKAEIPQEQDAQTEESEAKTPKGQGPKVKKSETRIPIGQGSQLSLQNLLELYQHKQEQLQHPQVI
ncbi:testis-expressed basic protein 1-like [Cervus canadensis]|uniref:testis-expressed basic protein 1-like n=1 Tax=Cervus canadensis TaxID=1574408 RepID=UPI001CA334FE|nr:testis-expressed basic protein 1-like [Cervus canadensis]